ncbi:MAG: MGH1-like glycoside hydrolase domain-containing protein [Terracidiphilus sp.]
MQRIRWVGIGVIVARLMCPGSLLSAQTASGTIASASSGEGDKREERSAEYGLLQTRLARGWNTWDVHSVATHVLLPEGLAIHVGLKHNTTLYGDAFLGDALIGRFGQGAEVVTPGAHAWDGSYTSADFEWKGHKWRIESAHDGSDLVLLVTPLAAKATSALPPTVVFSIDTLWNKYGWIYNRGYSIVAVYGKDDLQRVTCTCNVKDYEHTLVSISSGSLYFAADLAGPVGVSTARWTADGNIAEPRTVEQIRSVLDRQRKAYENSIADSGNNGPILDAIETTLGWDTIYDPEKQRVISPVSRVWSVGWGGYVLFDWDTFFAATLASIGDRDLAYANAIEILREETQQGFVPNYARAGGWRSSDRSEPPVGAITVLGLYKKFHDRWFFEETYEPLLKWNRWWAKHRDLQGYLAWGSDGDNQPADLDDSSRGTRGGAILESGLDNSPMYDSTTYNSQSHVLEFADVGLMSMYIADCDALAEIADALNKTADAKELRDRSARYRAKLATLWDERAGIFLNKDLHTGQSSMRLSPTNFYPMLAHAATPDQARTMVEKHLFNTKEFWGEWVIPAIERDDPAFKDQNYWRGRIWGPMNYLVYLGLMNYDDAETRKEFAQKSYDLFLKEWKEKGHVHENYNAIVGTGDDVTSSDRFYHWGALLGYVEYLEQSGEEKPAPSAH